MTTAFRGRPAVFFAVLCVAAMSLEDAATASGSLAGGAQPTSNNDGPSYNCQKRETVAPDIIGQ